MDPKVGVRSHVIWIASLLAFTLAAATGSFYRFGVAYSFTGGLDFMNVRHAHSHLMYFAWVTPALFLLIARRTEATTGVRAPRLAYASAGMALALGYASYIPFLVYGYGTVTIGPFEFPPAVIASGLNMLAWYGFILAYVRQTRGLHSTRTIVLFDAALLFLVLASAGAWAISLSVPLGVRSMALLSGFTHLFLGFFSEGWLLLAVLGIAISWQAAPRMSDRRFQVALVLVTAGIAGSFLLGMPRNYLSETARLLARIASAFMAVGLVAFAWEVLSMRKRFWAVPGVFLALKAVGFVIVVMTPTIWWSQFVAERILYFHIHLLGFATLGIMAAAGAAIAERAGLQLAFMNVAVVVVVLSLVPMTIFWPAALRGAWAVPAMAWASTLPVIVGFWMMVFQRPSIERSTEVRADFENS